MAVTKEQFEALKPVPYSRARPQLRTGDIVLFHSAAAPSELIEIFTESLWCHAAMIWVVPDIDRVMLLESVDKYGVRGTRLSNRINGCPPAPSRYPGKLLVLRHPRLPYPLPRQTGVNLMGYALDRLGYPYGTQELIDIAERIGAGMLGAALKGEVSSSTSFICSQYVAWCYQAAGIQLQPDRKGFIAPADIAADPNVQALCALCPD